MERAIIPKESVDEILRTQPNDITMKLLRDWMANKKSGDARFPHTAIIDIPESFRVTPSRDATAKNWDVRYAKNWNTVKSTTVGRFVANSLLFSNSRALREVIPYYDKPFTDKVIGEFQQAVMDARLAGDITSEDVAFFIDRAQWLGYAPTAFISPSMTIDTIRAPKATRMLKTQILAGERGRKIRDGDLIELNKVSGELLDSARKELNEKDPGMDIFTSGARGSFNNNFRNTAIMRGAIRKSDDPSQITISTASLEDGIPPEEQAAYADLIVQASYGRAMMTAQGGYFAKQLNAAFQTLRLNPDSKSDCRTPLTVHTQIDSPREYLFRFYEEGGKLKEILPSELDSVKGKYLKLRSPRFCGDKNGICSRCAGTLHHRMGVTNIGLIAQRIGTTLLNASLKAFHDSTLKLKRISLDQFTMELPKK